MSKKRYMELLLEQIRNKRAKELVAREINSHIEDQEEAPLQITGASSSSKRRLTDMIFVPSAASHGRIPCSVPTAIS